MNTFLKKLQDSNITDKLNQDPNNDPNESIFGIGRFITNQQNIYRVTPVHYLQKAEKKT